MWGILTLTSLAQDDGKKNENFSLKLKKLIQKFGL